MARKIPVIALVLFLAGVSRADAPLEPVGDPFGTLPLLDEVRCADPIDPHPFRESVAGASRISSVLGRRCRELRPGKQARYFAYRIGEGRGLVARQAYVLAIDYPEDEPRTLFIVNRGAGTSSGLHTGATVGDALWSGGNANPESLSTIPLAKTWRTATYLFMLEDRTPDLVLDARDPNRPLGPADGFWVALLNPARPDDPLSHGAAVARIRLFAVPDLAALSPAIRYPPAGVPRRHIVLRSASDNAFDSAGPAAGMANPEAWFEGAAQRLRFLGVNTWTTALLLEGRNTGWETGNDDWFAPAPDSLLWEKEVQLAERYGFEVLPYFEYAGSLSLDTAVPVRTLHRAAGRPYTNVPGGEPWHADVTDPRTLEDVRAVLDHTLLRYKDQVRILGAWFRTRVAQWPVSFSAGTLERFANEANGGTPVTREQVAGDPALRARVGEWWLGARRRFVGAVLDYLREKCGSDQRVLWTPWPSDGGPVLPGRVMQVVTDDPQPWEGDALADAHGHTAKVARLRTVTAEGRYLKAATAWQPGEGDQEWTYAQPRVDPERWRDRPGLMLTAPFVGTLATRDPAFWDAFRGPDGVAAIRFRPRNERVDGGLLGGIAADMERTGPFCMLEEAQAVATGDPVVLGELAADGTMRGFPGIVRRFHAAYLALPALPSARLDGAVTDHEIVVRSIRIEGRGTWLAVVNLGVVPRGGVSIKLPEDGPVTDAATGADLSSSQAGAGDQATLMLSLDPCELRVILVQPKPN